jgi:hypothetical protein
VCDSSEFSTLGVGVEDFVDYFTDVPTLPIQVPTASDVVGNFSFRNMLLFAVM